MFKIYIRLLILGHVLGDFYLQTEKMSKNKEKHFVAVLLHGAYYCVAMVMVHLPVLSKELIWTAVIAGACHLIIDIIKYGFLINVNKKNKKTKQLERNVFFVDQILHLICICFVAYYTIKSDVMIQEIPILKNFFDIIGLSEMTCMCWMVAVLLIHKPSNIAIQKIMMLYKPLEEDDTEIEKDKKAGRYIGTLERLIILLFLAVQQYSAIGLVMTAKSIARYDKISKDKNFAEYYLLGTLLSVIIALGVSYCVMG